MAQSHILVGANTELSAPTIRHITTADVWDALVKGWDDFCAMPSHAIFLCVIYPIVGAGLAALTLGYEVLPLLFPLAAGFALLGPIAAIGLYELSRRREAGMAVSATDAFQVFSSPSVGAIVALGILLTAIFLIWVATANAIYVAHFGYGSPESIGQFLHDVFMTSAGRSMIVIGNGVGFLFALAVLTISVVSFPLLLDRDAGAAGALLTSVRAVRGNPVPMALWGLIVAAGLVIGSIPFFLGLIVAMPVLGHATWHLYRRVVEPDTGPRPEFHPREKGRRYAADFPSSLFAPISRKDAQ
jgi:uncharacterized membrane protein